jgi:hypothetical protein
MYWSRNASEKLEFQIAIDEFNLIKTALTFVLALNVERIKIEEAENSR